MSKLLNIEFRTSVLQKKFLIILIGIILLSVTNVGNFIMGNKEARIMEANMWRLSDGTYASEENLERGRGIWMDTWGLVLTKANFRSVVCIAIPVMYVAMDFNRRKMSNYVYSGWRRNRIFIAKYIQSVLISEFFIMLSAYVVFFSSSEIWKNALFSYDVIFFVKSTLLMLFINMMSIMICTSICFIAKNPIISAVLSYLVLVPMTSIMNLMLGRYYKTISYNFALQYIREYELEMYTQPFVLSVIFLTVVCAALLIAAYLSFKRADLK